MNVVNALAVGPSATSGSPRSRAGWRASGRPRRPTIRKTDGLASDDLYALHVDSAGTLWAEPSAGPLARHTSGIYNLTTAGGLTSERVWSFLEDQEGTFWIGTAGGGLNALRRSSTFSRRDGLLHDGITVREDAEEPLDRLERRRARPPPRSGPNRSHTCARRRALQQPCGPRSACPTAARSSPRTAASRFSTRAASAA
jgi:hypothetical protein